MTTTHRAETTTSGRDSDIMTLFWSPLVLAMAGVIFLLLIFLLTSLLYIRSLKLKLNRVTEHTGEPSLKTLLCWCRDHVYSSVDNLSNNNRLTNTRVSTQDLSRPHLQRVPSQNSDDTYLVPVTSRDTMPAPPRALPPRPHKPSIRNIPDTDPKSPNIGYLEPSTPPYIEAGPADFRDWKKDLDNDSDTDTSVHAEFQEEYDSGSRTPKYRAKWLARSRQFSPVPQIVQKDEPSDRWPVTYAPFNVVTRFETGTRNPEDERQLLPFPVTMETLLKTRQRLRNAEFSPLHVNSAYTLPPIPPRKTAGRPKRLHRNKTCIVGQRQYCPRKVRADCEDTFSEASQRNIIKQNSNSCKIGQNSVEQPKNSYRIYPTRFTEWGNGNLGVKNEPVNNGRSGSDMELSDLRKYAPPSPPPPPPPRVAPPPLPQRTYRQLKTRETSFTKGRGLSARANGRHFSQFRKCEVLPGEGNGQAIDGSRPHFSQFRKCEVSLAEGNGPAIDGSRPHLSQFRKCEVSLAEGNGPAIDGSRPHLSQFRKCEVSLAEGNGPAIDGSRPHLSQFRKCEVSSAEGNGPAIDGSRPPLSQFRKCEVSSAEGNGPAVDGSRPQFSQSRKCEVSSAEGNDPAMGSSSPQFSQSRKCEISYVDGYDSAIGGSSPHSSQYNITNSPVSERTRRFSKHSMSPFAGSRGFLFDIGQM